MTAETLAGLAGTVAALAFAYIPGLRVRFAALSAEAKSGIMAMLLIVISGLIIASSCLNLWVAFACDKASILGFLQVVATALVLNQSVYSILPEAKDVRAAKAARKSLTSTTA